MSKYNLDHEIISSIVANQDMREYLKSRINKKHFRSSSCKIAWNWIKRYYDKYNQVPSKQLFREQFPNFELIRKKQFDPPEFLVNSILDREIYKVLVNAIADAGQDLQNSDPRKALQKLTVAMEKARHTSDNASDLVLADDTKFVIERYHNRKNSPLKAGMPYGYEPLDSNTDGMEPQQLGLVFGPTGEGKSWLACLFAVAVLNAGYRVLYITKENKDTEISNRVHALLYKLSPFRLRTGQLTVYEEKKLGRSYQRIQRILQNFIVSTQDEVDGLATGTESVRQKIRQYRPHLCVVDGVYLMTDDDLEGPEWKTLREMAYRLKRIARKENVHVLGVTQASAPGKDAGDSGGSLNDIAYAKGIGQACDIVINIYSNPELFSMGMKGIKLIKQREGPQPIDFVSSWDFNTPSFRAVDLEQSENEQAPIPS